MRSPATVRKPRTAKLRNFLAPRNGWIANLNLAQPHAQNPDGSAVSGAAVLDNWFPTATGVRLMRGSELYATLGLGDSPVTALFSYVAGTQAKLFGAIADAVYDITVVANPANEIVSTDDDEEIATEDDDVIGWQSTAGLEVLTDQAGGDWVVQQFATAGGIFLIGVNGAGDGFIYDGTTFYPNVAGGIVGLDYDAEAAAFTVGKTLTGATSGATATIVKITSATGTTGMLWLKSVAGGPFADNETIADDATGSATANGASAPLAPGLSFPDGVSLTTADLNYVWAYKQRLWFIQKDTLDAWYLPVDEVGGELTKLPLGGVFGLGGSLLFGGVWSNDAGEQGGLSEQVIFVTTEGEVAVYQGDNPGDATNWGKVGVYRIGRPLGKNAHIKAGGDVVIATNIGFIPVSQAISKDFAALAPVAVSYPIEVAWNDAVEQREGSPWACEVWPNKQMAVIVLPTINEQSPAMFIANVRTGAWCRRTNWDGTCLTVFQDRLFFGSQNGSVIEANVSGLDLKAPYTGVCVPLFDDFGSPAALKITALARAVMLAPTAVGEQVSMQADFVVDLPPNPDARPVPVGNQWGNAIWGTSLWGGSVVTVPQQNWRTPMGRGTGYALAPAVQVTSGSTVPIDPELVRVEVAYSAADIVT